MKICLAILVQNYRFKQYSFSTKADLKKGPSLILLVLFGSFGVLQNMLSHHLDEILLLQCASVPDCLTYEVVLGNNSEPVSETTEDENKSLGSRVVNELIKKFNSLGVHLRAIHQNTEIDQYCAHTSEISQMTSEVKTLLIFADKVTHWKCALDLTSLESLKNLVRELTEIVSSIQSRVSLASEYHELRTGVIGEIRRLALDPGLSSVDIDPLLFSLRHTLPNRIRQFAQTAEPHFSSEITILQNQASNLLRLVEKRINEFKLNELRHKLSTDDRSKVKEGSPHLTKIPLLRGLKHCQQLGGKHARILSGEEYIKHLKARGSPKSITRQSPRVALNRKTVPQNSTFSKLKCNQSMKGAKMIIPAPTRIENGRIVGPTWADLYGFKYGQFYQKSGLKTDQTSQCTTKMPKNLRKATCYTPHAAKLFPNTQEKIRGCDTPKICDSALAETPSTTLNNASFGFPPNFTLSTPLDPRLLDTPLAKKGGGNYISRDAILHQNSGF